jgi:hypothetical protein
MYAPQRLAVINSLLSSNEYRVGLITTAYSYLGRPPSGTEINIWLARLSAGVTDEQMTAAVLGTPEYFAHAPSVIGLVNPTNETFVRAIFKQLIPFAGTTDTDVNYWVSQIQRGLITRTGFALLILTGPTYRLDPTNGLVNLLYLHYMGRKATPAEIKMRAAQFAQGLTDEGLIASLLVSIEYFLRFHPYP